MLSKHRVLAMLSTLALSSHPNLVLVSQLGNRTSSFLKSKTSFVIGWMSVWSELLLHPICNLTDLTSPSLSGIFSMTHANGHSLRFVLFVFKITMSPTSIFFFKLFHYCWLCNILKNLFFHLNQNLFARCWILLHHCWL